MAEERRDDHQKHEARSEAAPAASAAPSAADDTTASWPEGIRKLAATELNALGIDMNQQLYWHGKPIALGQLFVFTTSQKVWGTILAVGALLAFLATVAQGWVAAATWACQVGLMHTLCPVS